MTWPTCSPDLMENLWGILFTAVDGNNKQYSNIKELEKAVRQDWQKMDVITLQKLFFSMKNRVFEVIRHNGGNTKY